MTPIARWRLIWTDLRTGARGGGEPIFGSKEEALEFQALVLEPAERIGKVYDAEMVFVNSETGEW